MSVFHERVVDDLPISCQNVEFAQKEPSARNRRINTRGGLRGQDGILQRAQIAIGQRNLDVRHREEGMLFRDLSELVEGAMGVAAGAPRLSEEERGIEIIRAVLKIFPQFTRGT